MNSKLTEWWEDPRIAWTCSRIGARMRLLLLSEQQDLSEKIRKACGEEHHLVIFLTPNSIDANTVGGFDVGICDERFFAQLKAIFQNPIFVLSSISGGKWT